MSDYQEIFQLPFELTNGNDGRGKNGIALILPEIYHLLRMSYPKIETGQKFGEWTAISEKGKITSCVCLCGTKREVASKSLWRGVSKSCGCIRNAKLKKRNAKLVNGKESTKHDLYHTWSSIKKRCLNSRCSAFKDYGGRGITVCNRWKNSFRDFVEDMGPRPRGASIDRIDNDKGYSPENCKWSTSCEQANNKRSSKYITLGDIKKTHSEWSRHLGGNDTLVFNRLRKGWSERDAVTKPIRKKK